MTASNEELVREFARWVIRQACWEGPDIDGGAVQDKAVELGLLRPCAYRAEEHGELAGEMGVEEGDQVFEFTAALSTPAENPALTAWREAVTELEAWKLAPESRANLLAVLSMLEVPPTDFDVDESTDDITVRWRREGEPISLALLFMGEVRVIASDLRGLSTPGDVDEDDIGYLIVDTVANITGNSDAWHDDFRDWYKPEAWLGSHRAAANYIARKMLAARGDVLEEWQPIETAPRDRTRIDLWGEHHGQRFAFCGAWSPAHDAWIDTDDTPLSVRPGGVGGWRPRPTPPPAMLSASPSQKEQDDG